MFHLVIRCSSDPFSGTTKLAGDTPGCGQQTVLDILGALCDKVARLGDDLHLPRYAPGITVLLLMDPSHAACTTGRPCELRSARG